MAECAATREERSADLWRRLKAGPYQAPPVRRGERPTGHGKTRPRGIPTGEDRLLHRAGARIRSAMYAQDFLAGAFGGRTGRHPHMALKARRDPLGTGKGRHGYATDLQGYVTHLHHQWLGKRIALRIADPGITG